MDVFVYGTLTSPKRARKLLDSFAFVGPAPLSGLHLVEGQHPTLVPGGRTAGRLLRTEEIDRIDRYERVEDGLYVRISVPLDVTDEDHARDYPEEVAVYVGDPDRLGADATWPGEGRSFEDCVHRYLMTADVRVRVGSSTPV